MIKIMKDCWNKNSDRLREVLAERTDLNSCNYETLVKLVFETVYSPECEWSSEELDLDNITVVDNGSYCGTLLFLIPLDTCDPNESDYLMTYIGYGSCSGCDALLAAQSCHWDEEKLDEDQIADFMLICKDIVCNTIRPYNHGWRHDDKFDQVEMEEQKMTAREKLKLEHPENVHEYYTGGCKKCPHDSEYNYLPPFPGCEVDYRSSEDRCHMCWDREIPGTEPNYRKENKTMEKKTEAQLIEEINTHMNTIHELRQDIEKLEKYRQYEDAANEMYAIYEATVNAGFTKEQAWELFMVGVKMAPQMMG